MVDALYQKKPQDSPDAKVGELFDKRINELGIKTGKGNNHKQFKVEYEKLAAATSLPGYSELNTDKIARVVATHLTVDGPKHEKSPAAWGTDSRGRGRGRSTSGRGRGRARGRRQDNFGNKTQKERGLAKTNARASRKTKVRVKTKARS